MRTLPLYPGDLRLAVEREDRREIDPKCTRCPLSVDVRSPCMGAEAVGAFAPGGVLVVGEFPSARDDASGRPFRAATGDYVRKLIAKHYSGPVVYDLAIRCAPSGKALAAKKPVERARDACRGYLAATLDEAQPGLILAMGTHGQHAVLGRAIPHTSLGGGAYAYTSQGVPVVMLPSPALAMRNRFLRANFEKAVRRALEEPFPAPEHLQGKAILVRNAHETMLALRAVRRARWAAFDIESWGLLFTPDYEITAIAIATPGSHDAWQWTRTALRDPAVRSLLVDWLCDPDALKIGANIKFDALGCFSFFGKMIEGVHGDIRLWRKLLEPEADARLETMAELVGQGGHKHEAQSEMAAQYARVTKRLAWERRQEIAAAAGRKFSTPEPMTLADLGMPRGIEAIARDPEVKKGAWVYGLLSSEVLYRYNSRDAVTTAAAGVRLERDISQTTQKIVWDHVVKDASVALTWIERWGAPVDMQALDYFEHSMRSARDDAKRVLDGYANINWGSSKQVAEFFFVKLGMTPPKISEETGLPSVDKEVLTILKPLHPAADALINYRRADKLLGTYAVGMRKHIRPDGRIHTSYLLDGATTGRAASRDPNLMNIPRADTPEGKLARNIFIPRPGWRLIQLDYSQLELRIAALLSGDPVMRDVFVSGVDYHQRTAEIIAPFAWKIQAHQVEKKHRSAAKAFNFGLIYGKSDATLAEDLGISVRDAAGIRAAILGTFTELDAAMKDWLREARTTGESWTMFGGVRTRRRPLWRIAEPEDGVRRNAENAAINTPIQGCQPARTRVLTGRGYERLGDAAETGVVWTGSKWSEYKKLDRGEWQLAEIDFANGATLTCDTRHAILVARDDGYRFVDFADLRAGDRVCYSMARESTAGSFANDMSADDAYWLGFATGNGHTCRNGVSICFGDRKGRYKKELKAAAWEAYARSHGFEPQARREYPGKVSVMVEGRAFRALWERFGYTWDVTAHHKRVPASIWTAHPAARRAYLIGLLDADGTIGSRGRSGPALHMCQREILAEVQILARISGVESTLRGPYGETDSYRLDFNGGQIARALDYGDRAKTTVPGMRAPRFVIDAFLRALPKKIPVGVPRTLVSRMRHGGDVSVYTLRDLAARLGVVIDVPLYAWHEVIGTRALDEREHTYTLAVNDPEHRFDSEGVITKNTAAEFATASLWPIVSWILDEGIPARVIGTVHDSIALEVEPAAVSEVVAFCRQAMLSHDAGDVPIVVDVDEGDRWGELSEYGAAA